MQNKSLIFKKVPTGTPKAGEHLVIENRPYDPQASAPDHGLSIHNLFLSFDPYQRGRMRDVKVESYSPAYKLDEPIKNSAIAKVIHSNDARFEEGDLITRYMSGDFEEYSVLQADDLGSDVWKLDNPFELDPSYFLGPLGMPGLTAYSSFYEIAQPVKGEIIFISAASGAVGSLVGQLAKREGLTVIGSVGDNAKLDYIIRELGFNSGFNYKEEEPMKALARLAPRGIDIYYENVGGAHLEAALASLKLWGRIVVSGMIADYNKPFEEKYGVRNLQVFFEKRLKMQGFLVTDLLGKYFDQHQRDVQKWINDGSLKVKMSVTKGMDNAIEGLLGLFAGENFGKAVLEV